VRANTFAAHFLLPPDSLQRLKPVTWDALTVVETATRLQVNVDTLLIALEREGLVASADAATLRHLKVARQDKPDPELPPTLSRQARARKEALLERGLSTDYVRLCLEAHDRSLISASRVAEMLLVDEAGLAEVADLFRWSPRHGS
ncbi:MAG: DNA-binding protein, partial [Acidobacteria bacterium]|nr:DNA-binding protein [Acidobacteriota bacterium]